MPELMDLWGDFPVIVNTLEKCKEDERVRKKKEEKEREQFEQKFKRGGRQFRSGYNR